MTENFYKLINFEAKTDEKGSLVAIEECFDIPFAIKRIYYIYNSSKDVVRGKHAHKNLQQIVLCVSGSCDFILDDGITKKTIHLDNPSQGLHIRNLIWREFTNFTTDCVIIVLASEHYTESDYINDYSIFINEITAK